MMSSISIIEMILVLLQGGSFVVLTKIAFSAGKLAQTVEDLDRRVALLEKAWLGSRAN